MKKPLFLSACVLLSCAISPLAAAPATQYFRDSSGKSAGTARQVGNMTIYRDNTGKTVGTARQVGNTTVYRDSSGKTVGTARDAAPASSGK